MAEWTPDSIRNLRQTLGMSRKAFATRVGASERSVRRWETGGVADMLTVYRDSLDRLAAQEEAARV